MSQHERISIVGGGYSGLTQAFYLLEAGFKVALYEKQDHLGGLIDSRLNNGFLVETAANAMLANAELERISKVIGVPLLEKLPSARKRFILKKGELCRWPLSVGESFNLLPFLMKKVFLSSRLRPQKSETLRQWGEQNLGADIVDNLVEPAMQGIYATTSENLNARLIYDSFCRRTKRGELTGSVSPLGGMGEWIRGLRKYLLSKDCEIHLQEEFSNFDRSKPLVLAVDLESLRQMVRSGQIHLPESILETSSVSLSTVVFCFDDKSKSMAEGFGCLFPKKENFHSLGVLFNQNIFQSRAGLGASETWILNDDSTSFSTMSPLALQRYVIGDRFELFKKQDLPDKVYCSQWPERIPLYDQNLACFLEDLEKIQSASLFIGNYLGDLGLAKIIFRAKDNLKKVKAGYFG